ncbi:hypothetical protein [Formosa sp. 4Alg 33]|uniref:hypothetical protein n=1 Tax=Formosa sp. 4Alg 33 TaxID=3382189 RepID=UPI003D9C1E04
MAECFRINTTENYEQKQRIISELKEYEKRLSYLRDLLAFHQLAIKGDTEMKEDYDGKINRLELKLSTLNDDKIDLRDLLKTGIKNLLKLDRCLNNEDLMKSRVLICSIFIEN